MSVLYESICESLTYQSASHLPFTKKEQVESYQEVHQLWKSHVTETSESFTHIVTSVTASEKVSLFQKLTLKL